MRACPALFCMALFYRAGCEHLRGVCSHPFEVCLRPQPRQTPERPATMADPAPVALSVTFDKPEGPPGEAHVKLYLADKLLADVGAALVAEAVVPVPGEVALPVDASVKQHGKTASEMRMPSYYVSMDCQASTVTYASGPVFNVSPGGSAQLVVKRK